MENARKIETEIQSRKARLFKILMNANKMINNVSEELLMKIMLKMWKNTETDKNALNYMIFNT